VKNTYFLKKEKRVNLIYSGEIKDLKKFFKNLLITSLFSFKRRRFRWPKSQPFESKTLKEKFIYLREVVGKKGAELH
jgi:hypothetical protein